MRQHASSQFAALTMALAVVVLAAVPTGCRGAADEHTFQLTFEPGSKHSAVGGRGQRWYDKLEEAPDQLENTHSALTENAVYYLAKIDGAQVIVAIEPKPLTLFVDTNLDNELADETPIKDSDVDTPAGEFGVVTVKGRAPGSVAVPLMLACSAPGEGTPPRLSVRPGGAYTGQVTLEGETYTIVVTDTTFNGRPNDLRSPGKPADTIAVDYNHDGKYDLWDEVRGLPVITGHGHSFYSISVAPDGSTITFQPAKPTTGKVEVTAPGAILSVSSTPGAYRVALRGKPMPLPVGKYNVFTLQILAWDDEDRRFRMQVLKLPEKLRSFEIRQGETTVLEIGPPMTAKALVTREGENVKIDVEVWGSYGERYFPYVRADSGGLDGWPGMRIYDEGGTELDSGRFEYG